MLRRFLASVLVLSLTTVLAVRAQEPFKPVDPAKASADQATVDQQVVAAKYRALEESLLKIAQKLDRGNAEARKKALIIFKALKEAREKNISVNLGELADDLKKPGLADLKKSIDRGKLAEKDLVDLLRLLMAEDDGGKKLIEFLANLLKQVDEALRAQKNALAKNTSPSVENADAKNSQKNATDKTDNILKDIKSFENKAKGDPKEAKGEPKKGESKDGKGESKDGKGESKDGKGESKDGKGESKDGKGESKDGKGESKDGKGESKDGKPSKGQPGEGEGKSGDGKSKPGEEQESLPGKQKIQDANDYQKSAADKIAKDKRPDAADDQQEAINKLEQFKKKLEDLLRQLREEEIERILADLEKRCYKMLQLQEVVYENTKKIDRRIQEASDKQPSREEEVASRTQSQREDDIVKEADMAIRIIEEEGTAVAFAEVFRQVRSDMVHVSNRLGKVNVGVETQAIEEDIIATLKEMIEALKKAQQESKDRKNPGNPGQPPPQNLIDLLAELRMIKMMQMRVNRRTDSYAKRYQGEQAVEPDIRRELKDLGLRQDQIQKITDNIAKGRNR